MTMLIVFSGFFLLASAIVANKMILSICSPMLLVGLRMLAGGLILLGLSLRSKTKTTWTTIKQDAPMLLIITFLTTFIPSLAKAYALKHLLSSKASFIGALDPFMTAIYAWFLFQERLSIKKIIGIMLGFIGAIIVCFAHTSIEKTVASLWIFSLPEIAAFIAVATSRLGWMLVQRYLKKNRYQPVQLNGLIMTLSGLIALPIACSTEVIIWKNIFGSYKMLGLLIYTIIIGNVIAYTMIAYFLKWFSSSFVSLAGFSVPAFVTFCGWAMLNEPIPIPLICGAAIIFTAVYFFYQEELHE